MYAGVVCCDGVEGCVGVNMNIYRRDEHGAEGGMVVNIIYQTSSAIIYIFKAMMNS
jgi:hypothetical protein